MDESALSRRSVLATAGVLAGAALAGCVAPSRRPSSGARTGDGSAGPWNGPMHDSPMHGSRPGGAMHGRGTRDAPVGDGSLAEWLDGVDGYDGLVDRRDRSAVTVAVGARGNGGWFAFDAPAIRVARGTTVTWEWTGQGGAHDVAAVDGSFGSDLADAAGATFRHTFDAPGTYRYYCTPHRPLGMRGAVVVD